VIEIVEAGRGYIIPRVLAGSTGPGTLRAYIEANLTFMHEHRNSMVAIVDIVRNGGLTTDGWPARRRPGCRRCDPAPPKSCWRASRPKGGSVATSTQG